MPLSLVYDTTELYQLTHLHHWAAMCKAETGLGSNGRAGPKVMLNSAEHEIYPALKC